MFTDRLVIPASTPYALLLAAIQTYPHWPEPNLLAGCWLETTLSRLVPALRAISPHEYVPHRPTHSLAGCFRYALPSPISRSPYPFAMYRYADFSIGPATTPLVLPATSSRKKTHFLLSHVGICPIFTIVGIMTSVTIAAPKSALSAPVKPSPRYNK
jgi:hypothetical protein